MRIFYFETCDTSQGTDSVQFNIKIARPLFAVSTVTSCLLHFYASGEFFPPEPSSFKCKALVNQ